MARSKEKSPEARAPRFVGALKVVPKLVASDQKTGCSWMLDICRVEDRIGKGAITYFLGPSLSLEVIL